MPFPAFGAPNEHFNRRKQYVRSGVWGKVQRQVRAALRVSPLLRMNLILTVSFLLLLATRRMSGQAVQPAPHAGLLTIHASATMVTVPAFVQNPSGGYVQGLTSTSFRLLDNGEPQHVRLENAGADPIALAVLMQTGASAASTFADDRYLPALVQDIVGASEHNIMFITFDSQVREIWQFPRRSDGIAYALTHQQPGDRGAAILDAVNSAIQALQQQQGRFRRIILLISQRADVGSRTSPAEVIQRLGRSSTTVYSAVFAVTHPKWPSRRRAVHRYRKPAAPTSPSTPAKRQQTSPLSTALEKLQYNTAPELSLLSGGAEGTFRTPGTLAQQLQSFADDIRHGYLLSFQPTSEEPGFHTLRLKIPNLARDLSVTARTSYWADPGVDSRK